MPRPPRHVPRLTDAQRELAGGYYFRGLAVARAAAPAEWARDPDRLRSLVGWAAVRAAAWWPGCGWDRFDRFADWQVKGLLSAEARWLAVRERDAGVADELARRRHDHAADRRVAEAEARVDLAWRLDRLPPRAAIVARAVLLDGLTEHAAARLARVKVELVRPMLSATIEELRRKA